MSEEKARILGLTKVQWAIILARNPRKTPPKNLKDYRMLKTEYIRRHGSLPAVWFPKQSPLDVDPRPMDFDAVDRMIGILSKSSQKDALLTNM